MDNRLDSRSKTREWRRRLNGARYKFMGKKPEKELIQEGVAVVCKSDGVKFNYDADGNIQSANVDIGSHTIPQSFDGKNDEVNVIAPDFQPDTINVSGAIVRCTECGRKHSIGYNCCGTISDDSPWGLSVIR